MRRWILRALLWLVIGAAINVVATWFLAIATGGDIWPRMQPSSTAQWPEPEFVPEGWPRPAEWGLRSSAWRTDEVAPRLEPVGEGVHHLRQMRVSEVGWPVRSTWAVVVMETNGSAETRVIHGGFEICSAALVERDDRLVPVRPIWLGVAIDTAAYAVLGAAVWRAACVICLWLARLGRLAWSCLPWLRTHFLHLPRRKKTWAALGLLVLVVGVDVASTWWTPSLARPKVCLALKAGVASVRWPGATGGGSPPPMTIRVPGSTLTYQMSDQARLALLAAIDQAAGLSPSLSGSLSAPYPVLSGGSTVSLSTAHSRLWPIWTTRQRRVVNAAGVGTKFEIVEFVLWPLHVLLAIPAVWLWYADRPKPGARDCRRCGYDLTGLVAGDGGLVVCPECGRKGASP